MEFTDNFIEIRNAIILKHLEYKREYIKDENELNIIDIKIKDLKNKIEEKLNNDKNGENNYQKFLDKINNDFEKYTLLRPWNRLSKEQKKTQMEIYLEHLINAENIEYIKELILRYLECGLLTKNNIKYDTKNGKITNVEGLEYNNEDNTYNLNLNVKNRKFPPSI